MKKNYGENKLQISTKQIKGDILFIEQVFSGDKQIGLMTRPKHPTAPVTAYYISKGNKIPVGTFHSGNFARRDAKKTIIDRYENDLNGQ